MKRETVPRSTRGWLVLPARGWLMLTEAVSAALQVTANYANRLRFAIAHLASIETSAAACLSTLFARADDLRNESSHLPTSINRARSARQVGIPDES